MDRSTAPLSCQPIFGRHYAGRPTAATQVSAAKMTQLLKIISSRLIAPPPKKKNVDAVLMRVVLSINRRNRLDASRGGEERAESLLLTIEVPSKA